MSFNLRCWLNSEIIFGKPLGLDSGDLIRFRVDNAGVFQRVAMNLNMAVGEAICRYTQSTLVASCVC